jgi:FkbM family methyltransferase
MFPVGAVATEVWWARQYEEGELALIVRAVSNGSTFLDLGSNAGVYALVVAASSPDTDVVAVEPATSTFQLLERNVALNHLANIRTVHSAVADFEGVAELSLNVTGKDGLNTLGVGTHPDSHVVGRESVPVMSLDQLVRKYGLANVSAIKVDVEGGELALFQGGSELLRSDQAPLILYEGFSFCTKGFGYHPVELAWLLESWGYRTFSLESRTGTVRPLRARKGQYDSMVVAAKPRHPVFEQLSTEARR